MKFWFQVYKHDVHLSSNVVGRTSKFTKCKLYKYILYHPGWPTHTHTIRPNPTH